jgi:hypothetical protein
MMCCTAFHICGMPGLDPGSHAFGFVDGRVKTGHDGVGVAGA